MGPLTLPAGGSVYIDANAIIYSVERIEPYRELLAPMWEEARAGRFRLTSQRACRIGDRSSSPCGKATPGLRCYSAPIFTAAEMELIPATLTVWEDAARIRAATGLKTSDALHAATALSTGSVLFITNDADFRRVQSLPIVVLDDLVLG